MNEAFSKAARRLGFAGVGFSPPEEPVFFDSFRAFIAKKYHGGMTWLERHLDVRRDPGRLLEGCRTVISLSYPYSSHKPSTPDGFAAARYAEPDKIDYHVRLRQASRLLTERLVEWFPGSRFRICVDSAPLLERSFAFTAGLGFIGKNNMLIMPGHGSYFFLVEILTTVAFDFERVHPVEEDCKTCKHCLDACPTGALQAPHSLDASRCLSYLTIEYKGAVGPETGKKMGNTFLGCDRCQEVCPFNRGGGRPSLPTLPSTEVILGMDEADFKEKLGNTALGRPGLLKLKQNIRAIQSARRDL